jgi:hypothetical protein
MSATHTYVVLPVSAAAFEEIKRKLTEAGYSHAFGEHGIDMHGLVVAPEKAMTTEEIEARFKEFWTGFAARHTREIPTHNPDIVQRVGVTELEEFAARSSFHAAVKLFNP